jgi:ribose transport system substrate-binding protein
MKKHLTALATVTMAAMLLTGCATTNQAGGGSDPTTSATASAGTAMKPTTKSEPLTIGYVPIVTNTTYNMILAGIQEEIDRQGGDNFARLVVQAPTSNDKSLQEQPNILEGLIQQKVDAIMLSTEDQDAMQPYIKEAAAKGIPVFLFNQAIVSEDDNNFVTNVSYDQYKASEAVGEWTKTRFGTKPTKIAVIEGYPGLLNDQRLKGFQDAIADSSNLTIVASQPGDWNRAKGQTVTENILQAHPDVQMIYGLYDEMALGALAAVKAAGKLDQITVVGYDNTQDANASIKARELQATVDTAAKSMGVSLLKSVKDFVIDGKTVPRSTMENTVVYDQSNIDSFDANNYIYVPRN